MHSTPKLPRGHTNLPVVRLELLSQLKLVENSTTRTNLALQQSETTATAAVTMADLVVLNKSDMSQDADSIQIDDNSRPASGGTNNGIGIVNPTLI